MSERYGHSKGKIYKTYKGSPKTKVRSKAAEYAGKNSESDSKTPPLPKRTISIEDLIKKRESLKKELKKIKHVEYDLSSTKSVANLDINEKHSKYDNASRIQNRKRTVKIKDRDDNKAKRKNEANDSTPEPTDTQIESEDEETLIERSRQRRKELLEKLNVPQMEPHSPNFIESDKNKEAKTEDSADNSTNPSEENIFKTSDMFSENDEFTSKNEPEKVTQDNEDGKNSQLIDNWDDSEGYYNVRIGDEIDNNHYIIKSILGQGVFSNVVRAQDTEKNTDVAIKIIRNNVLTYKTGIKEIEILKEIKDTDPDNKYHCIRIIRHFTHKGHLCMVMESLYMDLRNVIKKYGHRHGLHMKATMSYSRQLLIAMRLLKKMGIVHGDIKPDNILVNEKKNILKLCDFGSACKADQVEPTPYLVSRFYRAPEIILGIPYTHSIDIWSAACTIYEIATSKIMFAGSSNNKMLKCFMDLKGKFSTKLLKKSKFKDQHFNYNNNFLLHKKDAHTGREKYVETSYIPITRDLQRDFKKYCKNVNESDENKLLQLKDLLEKMLILDLNYRYSVNDCLKHPFIREEMDK